MLEPLEGAEGDKVPTPELGSTALRLGQGSSWQQLCEEPLHRLTPLPQPAPRAAIGSSKPSDSHARRPRLFAGVLGTQTPPELNGAVSLYLQFPPGIELLQLLLRAVHVSKLSGFPGHPGVLQSLVDGQSLLGVQDNQFSDLSPISDTQKGFICLMPLILSSSQTLL